MPMPRWFVPQYLHAVCHDPDQIFVSLLSRIKDNVDLHVLNIDGFYPWHVPDEPSEGQGAIIADMIFYLKQ